MLSYAFIVLHVSIILAGFTGVLGRLITLNEGLLVWYRVMLASVFFLLYLVIKNGRIRLPFKDILRIAWWDCFCASTGFYSTDLLNTLMFQSELSVLPQSAFLLRSLILFGVSAPFRFVKFLSVF